MTEHRPNKKLRGKKQKKTKNTSSSTHTDTTTHSDIPHSIKLKDDQRKNKQSLIDLDYAPDRIALFSHLPRTVIPDSLSQKVKPNEFIHPQVLRVGLKFHKRKLVGANCRCVAMLDAFVKVLEDLSFPPDISIYEHIITTINTQIQFLVDCRPMTYGMRNAVKAFKFAIGKTRNMDEAKIIGFLIAYLNGYVERKIDEAGATIQDEVISKINDGDVILTFAGSSLVRGIIEKAHITGINFRVIVVDSSPRYEGKILLRNLVEKGVECTYVLMTGLSYVISECSKVILGANAMVSNGSAISRVGTAVVAMMANAENIPVIFACETYKFHEKVQLDSIVSNEQEDPNELVNDPRAPSPDKSLSNWENSRNFNILNLEIDVTPTEFISAVATELGMIPPTSIPVVLRGQRDLPEI